MHGIPYSLKSTFDEYITATVRINIYKLIILGLFKVEVKIFCY